MRMFQKGFIILLLAVFGLALAACGSSPTAEPTEQQQSAVAVRDPYARPALAGDNGAAFFVVDNSTTAPIALVSAASNVAGTVEVHLSKMDGGVMKMEKQDRVEIPANSQLEFKPGSYHVMLINLSRDLKAGDTFKLTLGFESGDTLPIIVTVREP